MTASAAYLTHEIPAWLTAKGLKRSLENDQKPSPYWASSLSWGNRVVEAEGLKKRALQVPFFCSFPLGQLSGLRLVFFFKRQRHVAQIAFGFYQNQWRSLGFYHGRAFAGYANWLGFSGDGRLDCRNFPGVRVHPAQTGTLSHLRQFGQRQSKRLQFGHTGCNCNR